jgi:superfamily II DNA or RNA helicase
MVDMVGEADTPVLIFAAHASVARALDLSLAKERLKVALVHGSTPTKKKTAYLEAFKDGVLDVLIGTASLATGPDGLDKVCDTLVILDDTDDDALRRQLIGRIMPRGEDTDATGKKVFRLLLT